MKRSRQIDTFYQTLHLWVFCAASMCSLAADNPTEVQFAEAPHIGPNRDYYQKGRDVYERHCVICHGQFGDGQGEMAPGLGIKPRSFRAALFKYRSTPWGKLPTTDDLFRTVRGGRTNTAMGAFTHLTDEETRAVVEYIKFFSRKWRHEENYAPAIELPPPPSWLEDDPSERARNAEAGKQTFQSICSACHGPLGDGKGVAADFLRDDLGNPASPSDLRPLHLRCGDAPTDIYRVLTTGINGTPMVSFDQVLDTRQKWELIAYLLSLRGEFERSAR